MLHKDIFRDLHFILHVKTQKKDQDYSEDCIVDLRWPAAIFGNGGALFQIEFWACKPQPIFVMFGNRNNKCSNFIKL